MTDNELKLFLSPSNEYRGKPFWSWNGKLEADELVRQIGIMKEMGFGGFFIHSRIGLVDEYMGQTWMDMIGICVQEAKKLNMEVWLYDEDRWPSGFAGGLSVTNPEYAVKYIRLEISDGESFIWDDKYIAVFICDLVEYTYENYERIYRNTPFVKTAGKTILAFSTEYQKRAEYYNYSPYLDTLNIEAVNSFMDVTHRKYEGVFKSDFGSYIKGIFTDEATRGSLLDGFAVINDKPEMLVPWTYTVFDEFEKAFGYDLKDKLPELFLLREDEEFSLVKWQYIELLQRMYIENFVKPINAWCNENKLFLTGHFIEESTLFGQTALCGSIMRMYEHMGYPGIDALTKRFAFNSVKQVNSAARQCGKEQCLSELYGITGWIYTLKGHKATGDWQAVLGINFRCHHLSYYTMKGDGKRDCPASILHQSAWYKEYSYLEDYYSRLNALMNNKDEINDVLVINPVESVWGKVYPKFSHWLSCTDDDINAINDKYTSLVDLLCRERVGFDIGDEEMLSRLYRVEVINNTPYLWIGNARYKTVLISGLINIRQSTLNIINKFLEIGGNVIFTKDIPQFVDGLKSDEVSTITNKAILIDNKTENIILKLKETGNRVIEVLDNNGNAEDILAKANYTNGEYRVFLTNISTDKKYTCVKTKINHTGNVYEFDLKSGTIYSCEYEKAEGSIIIKADFNENEEHLFIVTDSILPQAESRQALQIIKESEASVVESYTSEKNVCVLDIAQYKINSRDWSEKTEVLRLEQKLRREYGLRNRGWVSDQPWHNKNHRKTDDIITLRYSFEIKDINISPIYFVCEVNDNMRVFLNSKELDLNASKDNWIDIAFKTFEMPAKYLEKGINYIEIEHLIEDDMELEPSYIVGDFGVELVDSDIILKKQERVLDIGDIKSQGYPFYGGCITYKLGNIPDINDGERLFISLDPQLIACMTIYNKSGAKRVIISEPYEADITDLAKDDIYLELILTRENTFGPLHMTCEVDAYMPDVYFTEGCNFTMGYNIKPCGLKSKPVFRLKACSRGE